MLPQSIAKSVLKGENNRQQKSLHAALPGYHLKPPTGRLIWTLPIYLPKGKSHLLHILSFHLKSGIRDILQEITVTAKFQVSTMMTLSVNRSCLRYFLLLLLLFCIIKEL